MSLIDSYSNICRTCLTENYNMNSIFKNDEFIKPSTTLHDILIACASIQIQKGDGLPEQVCLNCIQEMNKAYSFRKLCERSDAKLRNVLNSLPPLTQNVQSNLISTEQNSLPKNDHSNFLLQNIGSTLKDSKQSLTENDNLYEYNDIFIFNDSDMERSKNKSTQNNLKNGTKNINQESYYCKFCNKTYIELEVYKEHISICHDQLFKCNLKNNECNSNLLAHRKSSHKSNQELQNSEEKLIRNKTGIVKKRNQPRTCPICNKTFRFHSNLERHKLIHTGEKPYLCNECGKGFAQLSYLKIHSFIHSGEKPYKCHICDKSFAAPGTLVSHMRTHTGERPHICKICGKNFPQSGYLSSHIRTHTGEKLAECKICHRRFNQRGRLNIHMRIHSGEKPYSCKECGRNFAVKGTLKKHIRTHTGEKPYVCSVCGQAFAQNGTLATHMKIHKPK